MMMMVIKIRKWMRTEKIMRTEKRMERKCMAMLMLVPMHIRAVRLTELLFLLQKEKRKRG